LRNALPVTGNTEHTRPENRAFYPALDGLRAIAFLLVFMQHYYSIPWGWTGVNIFFVLSGFLITGILFDTRDDRHRARNFYVRRTLRIFPLYYGIFVLVLLTQHVMHWQQRSIWWLAWPLYLGNFLRYLSPAAGVFGTPQQTAADAQLRTPRDPYQGLFLGHFWSLCVEEQFYLLWPWIVFKARSRRTLLWICGVVVVFDPLLRVLLQHTAPRWMLQEELLYRATPFQLDSLLLGGLIGLLWRGAHRDRLVLIARVVAACAAVLTLVYLVHTINFSDPYWGRNYQYPKWPFTWGLSFVNIFAAALILCVLRPSGLLYRFFCLRPLRWIGRISYGAYVLHDIPHYWYSYVYARTGNIMERHVNASLGSMQIEHARLLMPVLALASTLLLAWLSFRFFESPFLNLKERWTIRGS
jgi:peptidoglycan/LPS O-acetylase OafA/YrhL